MSLRQPNSGGEDPTVSGKRQLDPPGTDADESVAQRSSQSTGDNDKTDNSRNPKRVRVGINNKAKVQLTHKRQIQEKITSRRSKTDTIVYGLSWSKLYIREGGTIPFRLLATCSRRFVNVYTMPIDDDNDDNDRPIDIHAVFQHKNTKESFYACEFVDGDDVEQDLCAGGELGVIFVLDIATQSFKRSLIGHGKEILDLKVSPTHGNLLLSSSKDRTCRLWNVRLGSTLAVFGGHEGHDAGVSSVAWHHSGKRFCSGGADVAIKVWELSAATIDAVAASQKLQQQQSSTDKLVPVEKSLHGIKLEHFPTFSTTQVHCSWVDCVHYVGDLVVSKSAADGVICLWLPEIKKKAEESFTATLFRTFPLENATFYYVKFAVDPSGQFIAAGNNNGTVVLWRILGPTGEPPQPVFQVELGVVAGAIRNLAFSPDGKLLAVSTDSGTVYRFSFQAQDE